MIEVDVKECVAVKGNMILIRYELPKPPCGYDRQSEWIDEPFILVLNKLDLLEKIK